MTEHFQNKSGDQRLETKSKLQAGNSDWCTQKQNDKRVRIEEKEKVRIFYTKTFTLF